MYQCVLKKCVDILRLRACPFSEPENSRSKKTWVNCTWQGRWERMVGAYASGSGILQRLIAEIAQNKPSTLHVNLPPTFKFIRGIQMPRSATKHGETLFNAITSCLVKRRSIWSFVSKETECLNIQRRALRWGSWCWRPPACFLHELWIG